VGLVGACEFVGPQVVERLHREQRLDRAGGRVLPVRVVRGENASRVEVGQQPCLCGSSAAAVGAATAKLTNASAVTNAANIFRTGAERILCDRWF